MRHDGINQELLSRYAPRPGRKPLLPALGDRQQLALLCRVLSREGYNDHIAGHITLRLDDGTYLANPWELTWSELTASDILRLDAKGNVIEGTDQLLSADSQKQKEDLFSEFFANASMTPEDAQKRFVDIISSAD